MQLTKSFSPTMAQEKRIEDAEHLIGKDVYLKGTKFTTKIKGVVDAVDVINPEKRGENIQIRFTVLWEGQQQPFYTNRTGFQI
tara:strand:+ start:158 stop:406 length:249 start_codon:yes stop_codon:yes gene_type:complete